MSSWTWSKVVRHEHVIERDWMARFLEEHPSAVTEALWEYPACLVTKAEHERLAKSWGWRRYLEASVRVVDAASGKEVNLDAMDVELRTSYETWGGRFL